MASRRDRWIRGLAVAATLVAACSAVARDAEAQRRYPRYPRHPHHAPKPRTAPPLPFLPTLERIRIEVLRDAVLVISDVTLPRGTWERGDIKLFSAFHAPFMPRAVEAELFGLFPKEFHVRAAEPSLRVPWEPSPGHPPSAQPLLGPDTMTGVILTVREPSMRAALRHDHRARLRVRQLHDAPRVESDGGREIIVRLGAPAQLPITLRAIEIQSGDDKLVVTSARATLCGPDADDWPLAFSSATAEHEPVPGDGRMPLAPVRSIRRNTDSLCVRYWTSVTK